MAEEEVVAHLLVGRPLFGEHPEGEERRELEAEENPN